MARNLVLGIARNYALATIAPFIASLRRAAPDAELCLYASGMDAAFHRAADAFAIRVEDPAPYDALPYNDMIRRLFMYDAFLRQHGDRFRSVLLTDVRDVVFQSDPFAAPRQAEVLLAPEDGLIRESPLNMRWIAGVYGPAAAEEIGGNPILCAGTVLGSVAGVRRYLADMIEQIETQPYDRSVNFDQGMHNHLGWKLRPPYAAVDHGRDVFRTLGLTGRDRVELDGIIVRVDGVASPVLHQWDRHERLQAMIGGSPAFQLPEPGGTPPSAPPSAAAGSPVIGAARAETGDDGHDDDLSGFVPAVWRYLVDRHAIATMLDVECGAGRAARFFHRLGVVAHGIDGQRRNLGRAVHPVALHDLHAGPYIMPVDLVWSAGLVWRAELAGPPTPAQASHYLDTLANGRVIAMMPGAEDQAPDAWIAGLAARGYRLAPETDMFRRIAAAAPEPNRFQTSGLIFVRTP